jgi:lipoprotein-anchoring transpeptidase ErfK/SrfK
MSLVHFIRRALAACCAVVVLINPISPQAATAFIHGAADGVPAGEASSAPRKGKWIEVVLAQQRLNAWEDGSIVMSTAISSGTRRTPTIRGTFRVYRKYRSARMRGPGYDLPHVPYVMFYSGSYGIHGTYWHSNFGRPMSHGCVNMPTGKAGWLFKWAPPGTVVVIH